MEVNIRRVRKNTVIPEYKTKGAVGFDFAAAKGAVIEPKKLALIPTGLSMQVPEGHMLMITARSSLAKKRGLMLANGVGTIDQDYCGPDDEIHMMVYNFTDQSVTVEAGERLANGLFLPIERAQWKEVELMKTESRGGFGSTGR